MRKESDTEQLRRLEDLAALPEDTADTGDIPEVPDWSGAVRGNLYRPRKLLTSLRLDADVLEWFKAQGAGYQTAMNGVLRDYATGRLRLIPHDAGQRPEHGGMFQRVGESDEGAQEKETVPEPRS